MICKWCGASVNAADKKCGRCGREIPALSDCGGFYDVAPKAPRPEGAPKPAAAPVQPVQPVVKEPKKNNAPVVIVAVLVVIALVVGQVLLMMKLGDLEATVQSLRVELDELQETQVAPEEPKDDPDDEPDDDDDDNRPKPTGNEKPGETTAPTGEKTDQDASDLWNGLWTGVVLSDDLRDTAGEATELSFGEKSVDVARTTDGEDGTITYSFEKFAPNNTISIRYRTTEDGKLELTCTAVGDVFSVLAQEVQAELYVGDMKVEKRGAIVASCDDGAMTVTIDLDEFDMAEGTQLKCVTEWSCVDSQGHDVMPLTISLAGLETLTV